MFARIELVCDIISKQVVFQLELHPGSQMKLPIIYLLNYLIVEQYRLCGMNINL